MKFKSIITFFLTISLYPCYGQLTFNFQHNIDFYKPYTPEAQEYMKLNDKVYSGVNGIQVSYPILNRNEYKLRVGVAYKNIRHVVEDKIKVIKYHAYSSGQIIDTFYHNTRVDLESTSNSFAILLDFQYPLLNRKKYNGNIGVASEIFLIEMFNAEYKIWDEPPTYYYAEPTPMYRRSSIFIFSALNLSCYYLNSWQLSEKFSLGVKFSIGTNIYSDWDQFKRYAWLGVGLELGFGKSKTKVKDNLEE